MRKEPEPEPELELEPEPNLAMLKESQGDLQPSARRVSSVESQSGARLSSLQHLKRRAGRPVDLFQDDNFEASASIDLEPTQKPFMEPSLGPSAQPSISNSESIQQDSQSTVVDSLVSLRLILGSNLPIFLDAVDPRQIPAETSWRTRLSVKF